MMHAGSARRCNAFGSGLNPDWHAHLKLILVPTLEVDFCTHLSTGSHWRGSRHGSEAPHFL